MGVIVAIKLTHILIRNCDWFDCYTRRTIDGIIALLSDFIKSITTRGNVTHLSVNNGVGLMCQSEVEHITIQLDDIYVWVIITNPVRSAISTTVF